MDHKTLPVHRKGKSTIIKILLIKMANVTKQDGKNSWEEDERSIY